MQRKKGIVLIIFWLTAFSAFAQYQVSGGTGEPYLAENDTKNRLEIYLLNGLTGAEISFTSADNQPHQWYSYETIYTDRTPVTCIQSGNRSSITDIVDGRGYYVEIPGESSPRCVWIMDYSRYLPTFYRLNYEEGDDQCEFLKLVADVDAAPLRYYTPFGVRSELQRTYHLSYNDLTWNEEDFSFSENPVNREVQGVVAEIPVPAPLRNTDFTLTGDLFAEHFGLAKKLITQEYQAIAVRAYSTAEFQKKSGESEQLANGGDLTFTSPTQVLFTAYANEPVAAMYLWQISHWDENTGKESVLVHYPSKELSYLFGDQSGRFTARLEVIDSRSLCVDTLQVYTITVGETDIKVPNFFSPGSSLGVNDEFRVSYKSLVKYKCSIVNQWGNVLFESTDPDEGWDGRIAGNYVPSGV
ncbi:MAG: gliding motility-associated C-terminal domain-containing protein, partial [Dysgonamonadaceae bacterium]|nr:gliding motility-associated C-terminal domain-containing protein [Dysgonamonadaceae bacterium]